MTNVQNAAGSSEVFRDFERIYRKTAEKLDEAVKWDFYPEVLSALREGDATVELRKRVMLRALDETWVRAIEDALPALDRRVRFPNRFIREDEWILPIELSRHIVPRSISHLARHANLVAKVEGEEVTPYKILNVLRDETMQTYENKFVNTLLRRLSAFVSLRYDRAKACAKDTKTTTLTFREDFNHGKVKGRIRFVMELAEPSDGQNEQSDVRLSDLWRRVERLNDICRSYLHSPFAQNMEGAVVRPPIQRTNAILKNPELRECLALWQFIESYENIGYTTTVRESLEEVDAAYIKDLYATMAEEYVLFRHHLRFGFEEDKTLAVSGDLAFHPRVEDRLIPTDEREYHYHVDRRIPMPCTKRELTATDLDLLEQIEIALDACDRMDREQDRQDRRIAARLRRSFLSRLIQTDERIQNYYTVLKNELLSYRKVKSRVSWHYDAFGKGRIKCAKIAFKGKTLTLFLRLAPSEFDAARYHHKDASDVAKYAETPLQLRVRSNRALKYAIELIGAMMARLGIEKGAAKADNYRLPYETDAALIRKGLIRVVGALPHFSGEPTGEAPLFGIAKADQREVDATDGETSAAPIDGEQGADESVNAENRENESEDEEAVSKENESREAEKKEKESAEAMPAQPLPSPFFTAARTRLPFLSRLDRADERIQKYYTALKNELLSYRKVKSRVSHRYDAFGKGRIKCAKIAFKGKTLTLFLRLAPSEFDAARYHHKDASDVAKYAETPLQLRVRSDRALKYAIELIGVMMREQQISRFEEKMQTKEDKIAHLSPEKPVESAHKPIFSVDGESSDFPPERKEAGERTAPPPDADDPPAVPPVAPSPPEPEEKRTIGQWLRRLFGRPLR